MRGENKERDLQVPIRGGQQSEKVCDRKIKEDFISCSEHYTLGITCNKVVFFQVVIYS